jgi:maleate cis-trans isomerase
MRRTIERFRGRIGIIVPSSNTNLEPDVCALLPVGVTAHFTRAGTYDVDAVPDSDEMRHFAMESLDDPIRMLCAAAVGVLAYGCTSASLAHGPRFDQELAERISSAGNVPAVTAASAIVHGLKRLGVERIGLASPYVPELNREAAAFLEAAGFQVLSIAGPDRSLSSRDQGMLPPSAAYALGKQADHRAAEAVVLSCTELRSVEIIDALERDIRKPVVTSNQALVFACLGHLGVDTAEVRGAGRLFEVPPMMSPATGVENGRAIVPVSV